MSDWMKELGDRVKHAKAQGEAQARAAQEQRERRAPLLENLIERLFTEGDRLAKQFNDAVPGYQAYVERRGDAVTFGISNLKLVLTFDRENASVHGSRSKGRELSEGAGPKLSESNGTFLIDDKTPEEYADKTLRDIAKAAVRV
jgi:hypothetical protein